MPTTGLGVKVPVIASSGHGINIQFQTTTFAHFIPDFRNAHGSFAHIDPFLT
jgi:hypothetical protein